MKRPFDRHWPAVLTVLFLVLIAAVGCSSKPRKYPVHGVVRFPDGKVLSRGWIEFEGVHDHERIVARSEIAEDGSFTLGTDRSDDGAFAGVYRAVVISDNMIGNGVERPGLIAPIRLHSKYRQFETSGLQFTVEPRTNELLIEVAYSPDFPSGS